MCPIAQQAKVARHAEQKERQGESDADPELKRLVGDLRLTGFGLDVFQRLCGVGGCLHHAVSCRFDRLDHRRDGRHAGDVLDAGPLGGEIDVGLDDAVHLLAQRPPDGGGAVGARHTGDGQLDLGGHDAIACVFYLLHQVGGFELPRIERHRRLLGGKVDHRVRNTLYLLEAALHGEGAVGAVHLGDG